MIDMTEETTEPTQRLIYRSSAPDGSNMVAVVENDVACFTVGGMQLNVTIEALPAFMALSSSVLAASVVQVSPELPIEPE